MSKRVRRNDQDYLRFQPYRAIVAPPLKSEASGAGSTLKKGAILAAVGALVAIFLYFLWDFLPAH